MALTIYNHSAFPNAYELKYGNFRQGIPPGKSTHHTMKGIEICQKGGPRVCGWAVQTGECMDHNPTPLGDRLVQTGCTLTIEPNYMKIISNTTTPYELHWPNGTVTPIEPFATITMEDPNMCWIGRDEQGQGFWYGDRWIQDSFVQHIDEFKMDTPCRTLLIE